LVRNETAPLRVLCAPHGSGKTTALAQYAAGRSGVSMVALPPGATPAEVDARLDTLPASGLAIVDAADAASPEGIAALFRSIEAHVPDGRRYLLSGSSRTQLRVQPMLARGVASLVEASLLPFTSADIAALAAAHGVVADALDAEQLRFDTDGWPIAVAWIIRDAARDGRALRGAFEQWHERNGHMLLELVTLAHDDDASARAFVAAIRSLAEPASQRVLERLDAHGYPIVRMRTSLRPYRILTHVATGAAVPSRPETSDGRLVVRLFGRFACTVARRTVVFERRRDQNILAYVALAPGASVTRAALLEAFWPGASPAVASQGLRTTLCRLRRALADAAGTDAARFLRVDHAVALDLEWVEIDARTFRACVERADAERSDGNRTAAREHYRQAERLYTGSLLASEAIEAALAPHAADYGLRFAAVLAHLVEIYTEDGNAKLRRAFADRSAALSAQPA
jgi:hypothetical protein